MAEMTRRDWLGAASAGAVASGAQSQPAAAKKPNIVLIISDQFRADNLGCMGMNRFM